MPCGPRASLGPRRRPSSPRRRVHAHVAEDELRAPRIAIRPPPDHLDVPYQGVDLRGWGRFGCARREHPGVEGQLPPVGGDGQRVVLPRVHLLGAERARSARPAPLEPVCCSSDIGQATTVGLSPARRGLGRSSISAVCTSAKARNICWSSGRLVNRANRLRGLKSPAPSGEISIVSTTSPKVAAQASKCSMPRSRRAPQGRGTAASCTSRPSCSRWACRWRRSRRGRRGGSPK